MKACRTILSLSLFLGLACLSTQAWAETLTCPEHWPEDPNAKLASGTIWAADGWEANVPAANDDVEDFVADFPDAYYEVACRYQNGRRLYIPVPGQKRRCHIKFHIDYSHTNVSWPDYQVRKLWCTYQRTGDAQKNKVNVVEIEELSRQTVLYGIHLGMTPSEVAASWRDAGDQVSADQRSAKAADGALLTASYNETTGTLDKLAIKPADGSGTKPYLPMQKRFGESQKKRHYAAPDERVCYAWEGADGAKLEFDVPNYHDETVLEIRLIDLKTRQTPCERP